jgi:putative aldouronate transport system substrate-binding protein
MGNDGLFQEGYDWEWDENCDIKLLEWQTGTSFRDVGFHHATYPGYQQHADMNRQRLRKMDPSELSKVEQYFIRDPGLARQEVAYAQVFEEAEYEIENEYLGVNTERMNELLPDLQKMEEEFYLSIVLGLKPLDAFNEYVSKWHELGGDEVAEDVNAWYESHMSS